MGIISSVVRLHPWKMILVAIQAPGKMEHLKNCEELCAIAHDHRNNIVMLCLMEETLSPQDFLLRRSPWLLASLWCALLGSGAQPWLGCPVAQGSWAIPS